MSVDNKASIKKTSSPFVHFPASLESIFSFLTDPPGQTKRHNVNPKMSNPLGMIEQPTVEERLDENSKGEPALGMAWACDMHPDFPVTLFATERFRSLNRNSKERRAEWIPWASLIGEVNFFCPEGCGRWSGSYTPRNYREDKTSEHQHTLASMFHCPDVTVLTWLLEAIRPLS